MKDVPFYAVLQFCKKNKFKGIKINLFSMKVHFQFRSFLLEQKDLAFL